MTAAGVIFDMDGVLVDSGAHHRAAWRALLDELGVAPPADAWRLTIGRPAEEGVQRLVGRTLGVDEARRLAARKQHHYAGFAARGIQPVPGVTGFVERLAGLGVPRAVATSASRRDLEQLLRAVGLRHHFAVVVAAEDVRRGKPDPEVYLLAAEGLGLAPGTCLVFEDSLVGVEAARRAGMTVVGVSTAHAEGELVAAGAARVIGSVDGATWPP